MTRKRWTSRKFLVTAAVVMAMFMAAYQVAGDDWVAAMKEMGALLIAALTAMRYVAHEAKVDAAKKDPDE